MALSLYQIEKKMKPIEAHRPTLSKQELESVLDCLINDQLGTGKTVQRFEKSFATTFNFKHVLAVSSLAAAYHLAFQSLGIKSDDYILMSALSPIQAYDAVRYIGAQPILIDVAQGSFHPDPDSLESVLEKIEREYQKLPAAFILDHTFGSLSPLNNAFFKEKEIKTIEDFTGLVGTEAKGEFPGKSGNLAVCGLSQYDLLTTGNGAVVVAPTSALYKELISLGYGTRRLPGSVAYDYRISDFQAAMGLDQLSRLGITIARRKKIGQKYLEILRLTKHETYFKNPGIDSYLQFPVVFNQNQDEVLRYFDALQIGVTRSVDIPLHHLMDLPHMEYANAERIFRKSAAIPVYPNLTANNIERISSSLRGLL